MVVGCWKVSVNRGVTVEIGSRTIDTAGSKLSRSSFSSLRSFVVIDLDCKFVSYAIILM